METYRGMDRAALSDAYNNRGVVPDWEQYMADWRQRSQILYESAHCLRDLSYGPGNWRHRFDVFPGTEQALPTVLYLHGGYWQWNNKEGQAFVAKGALSHGFSVAIGEHSLAPEVSMTELVDEVANLVVAVSENARSAGRNPGVALVGMSSGAHLLALTLDMKEAVCALLISGAYDLEPIRISSLNDAIGMDWDEARRFSPLHRPHRVTKPVTLAFGSRERPEIRRQGTDFHEVLTERGLDSKLLPITDKDHFSVLETLEDGAGVLCQALTQVVQRCVVL